MFEQYAVHGLFFSKECSEDRAGDGSAQFVADLTSGASADLIKEFPQDTLVGFLLPCRGPFGSLLFLQPFSFLPLQAYAFLFLGRELSFLFQQLLLFR